MSDDKDIVQWPADL